MKLNRSISSALTTCAERSATKARRTGLVLTLGLELVGLAPSVQSAPVASHWTVTDLGTLGGASSYGNAINAAGQVTGSAYLAGNILQHAFIYSNGVMTDLNTLGGTSSLKFRRPSPEFA